MISISNATGADNLASQIVCRFENGYQLPVNYVPRVVLCSGANPSYAILSVPVKSKPQQGGTTNWDQSYGVACINNGPAGQIKPFAKGTVGLLTATKQFYPLLHGRVAYTSNLLGQSDVVMPCLFDPRWDLDKFTVGGRMLTDGSKVWWDGSETIYNRFGHGDCMDVGGKPFHSQGHRYGHTANEDYDAEDEPEPGYASSKSRKWRCTDIIANLRTRFVYGAGRPSMWQDFGLQDIPDDIIWPEDLGSNIKENRTPRDMNLQGMSLLSALQKVVRYAGPYDITLVALPDGKSELRVIDFAPKKQSGLIFYDSTYATINLASASKTPNLIIGGFIKESVVNCYPGGVAVIGDKASTERMCSTDSSGTGALYLSQGWTSQEEQSYKLKIAAYEEDRFAFDYANKCHMSVYNYYKLNPNKNPFAGTKWANAPQNGALTIKAHQLTSYNESNNPAGLTPREIVIEAKRTQEEYDALPDDLELPNNKTRMGWWYYVGRYSELQLDPSRTMIRVDALRENKSTWAITNTGDATGEYDTAYMAPRKIRIQLVAESNHQIVARLGGNGDDASDPQKIDKRIDPDAPKFCMNMYNQPLQYVDWTRTNGSRPIGEATVPGNLLAKFPAKSSQGNELFTDLVGDGNFDNPKNRLLKHAKVNLQNYKRIEYSGQFELTGLHAGYLPGMQLAYENGSPIGDVSGIIKCVVLDNANQRTILEWGPAEFSAIYDAVAPVQGSGGTTLASPPEKGPKKEEVKKEESGNGNGGKEKATEYKDKPQTEAIKYEESKSSEPEEQITSANDSTSSNSGMQAMGEMAGKAEGDITGFQSLGKVLNAAGSDEKAAKMAAIDADLIAEGEDPNAGKSSPIGDSKSSVPMAGESMEAYGERMKRNNTMDMIKDGMPSAPSEKAQKKGTIKADGVEGYDQIKSKDYNLGEGSGFDSETRKAGKGIYSGDSLKALDEDRKQDSFAEGGLRDTFRAGAGQKATNGRPPEKSYLDQTYGKADKNGLRYSNVDRGGFNPNNAAPKSNNNRGEPIKPKMSLEDAKRSFGRSVGISNAQFDANRARAEKGRNRK